MNFQDESVLIDQIQHDDPEAFEKLFLKYHGRVYAFALRIMPSPQDAEEVVQNVFMAVWNQRKTFRISSSLLSYLYGITRNLVCSMIRQRIRHDAFVEYFLERNEVSENRTEEDVLFNDLFAELERLMDDLPPRRREIFRLNRFDGLSYSEISKKLDISENTVDTQIRHALHYIRDKISNYPSG